MLYMGRLPLPQNLRLVKHPARPERRNCNFYSKALQNLIAAS